LEKNLVIDIFLKPGFVNSQSFVNFNLIFINLVNMKRFFPFIAAILLLSTCKKGTTVTPNPPLLDVLGKWSLYSSKQPGSDVTVAQLPCLADNILQINADGTTTSSYIGTDTCFTVRPTGPFTGWSAIGLPGQSVYASTWSRDGNNIYIGGEHNVISSTNNQLYLTETDTITVDVTSPLIMQAVYVKQQ